ncbi:hypothetical protein CYMTET_42323 [Cymbomonas tetramitiformis]|uniref:Uncharacterized protein n=1 Tax=Cymbomonas tetramitiformis TaxID=36881 RepID=A0AAE0C5F5_9CHLO|nr:hypothetical protein CYMTET_42323 [Cymbomonas tetramitiformis]
MRDNKFANAVTRLTGASTDYWKSAPVVPVLVTYSRSDIKVSGEIMELSWRTPTQQANSYWSTLWATPVDDPASRKITKFQRGQIESEARRLQTQPPKSPFDPYPIRIPSQDFDEAADDVDDDAVIACHNQSFEANKGVVLCVLAVLLFACVGIISIITDNEFQKTLSPAKQPHAVLSDNLILPVIASRESSTALRAHINFVVKFDGMSVDDFTSRHEKAFRAAIVKFAGVSANDIDMNTDSLVKMSRPGDAKGVLVSTVVDFSAESGDLSSQAASLSAPQFKSYLLGAKGSLFKDAMSWATNIAAGDITVVEVSSGENGGLIRNNATMISRRTALGE